MTTKLRTIAPMAPKPHRVAMDNPHGTTWTIAATGIVTNPIEREAGFSVWAHFKCDEGWWADYGYKQEGPDRGWHLWAN